MGKQTQLRKAPHDDSSNVVEQAIAAVGASPGELAKRLSIEMGVEVSRQRVNGWRGRGVFPRDVIVHVSKVCKIPLASLASAKQADRDSGNIVARAIRLCGGSAGTLAAELTKLTPEPVTRQMVNGWLIREQFPMEMIPWVYIATKIPVKLLVVRKRTK